MKTRRYDCPRKEQNSYAFDVQYQHALGGRPSTVRIGKVEFGDELSIVNSGTNVDAVIDVTIPRGIKLSSEDW